MVMNLPSEIAKLRQIITGYKPAIILGVAVRFRIFSCIGAGELTASELAKQIGTDTDGLERLLDTLTAFELVEKVGNRYRNTNAARELLVEDSAKYQGGYISYVYDILNDWLKLEERVRSGHASRATYDQMVGKDAGKTKDFMAAMHANALPGAQFLLSVVDFSKSMRMLDVGCGAGTYSIVIAAKYPAVHCDLVDLPAITSIAETYITSSGLGDRVHVSVADYMRDPLPTGYDTLLLLAVIHQESPDGVEALFKKAYKSLVTGGRLILSTFALDESRTAPLFSVLFGLEMLVLTPNGKAYTLQEIRELLERVGFTGVEPLQGSSGPAQFIIACRP